MLVAEVDATLGDAAVPPSFETARGFDRIEASVTEAMRLYPVAPVIFHQANRDLVLDGLQIPAGTGAQVARIKQVATRRDDLIVGQKAESAARAAKAANDAAAAALPAAE